MTAAMHVPDDARRVLDRACRDCHSNETRWPRYSNVAPVSWFVIDHVNHGRRHFNYSDWASHDEKDRNQILENVCKMVRKGEMPIAFYTWMHLESRVRDADAAILCE